MCIFLFISGSFGQRTKSTVRKIPKSKFQQVYRHFHALLFKHIVSIEDYTKVVQTKNSKSSSVFYITSNELQRKVYSSFRCSHTFSDLVPNGVITFQRFALPSNKFPPWNDSKADLCDLSLLTGEKIEDIRNALQVDFANKYIVSFCTFIVS